MLEGEVLFGASFVEDPDLPDRGTTLLFGWPDPLEPASWPWQANWVVGDSDSQDDAEAEELDLFENGELEGDEALVPAWRPSSRPTPKKRAPRCATPRWR